MYRKSTTSETKSLSDERVEKWPFFVRVGGNREVGQVANVVQGGMPFFCELGHWGHIYAGNRRG